MDPVRSATELSNRAVVLDLSKDNCETDLELLDVTRRQLDEANERLQQLNNILSELMVILNRVRYEHISGNEDVAIRQTIMALMRIVNPRGVMVENREIPLIQVLTVAVQEAQRKVENQSQFIHELEVTVNDEEAHVNELKIDLEALCEEFSTYFANFVRGMEDYIHTVINVYRPVGNDSGNMSDISEQ